MLGLDVTTYILLADMGHKARTAVLARKREPRVIGWGFCAKLLLDVLNES
jgi:hypothetical protein